ncbi:MAG TPA: ElyC/SanA/YdcF family protein [Cyclobacteriaceae bacterium]|nr:ElyC/SanA/YdcF family protein [Cyclobacteriaceae bacterium]
MLKKLLRIVLYLHLFVALALLLTYCSVRKSVIKSYALAKETRPYDVIIVPGIPYEKSETSMVMKMRIQWAKHLYDSGFTRNIIFSGSAVYSPFVEGIAMKVIADSLGIPAQHTFSETSAEHSTENVYYSWKMAKEMGFTKIALATDPFQAAMLKRFIKEYCPGVTAVPVYIEKIDLDKPLPVIDTTSFYVANFVSLKERETFWQRFSGTRGKKVVDEVNRQQKDNSN